MLSNNYVQTWILGSVDFTRRTYSFQPLVDHTYLPPNIIFLLVVFAVKPQICELPHHPQTGRMHVVSCNTSDCIEWGQSVHNCYSLYTFDRILICGLKGISGLLAPCSRYHYRWPMGIVSSRWTIVGWDSYTRCFAPITSMFTIKLLCVPDDCTGRCITTKAQRNYLNKHKKTIPIMYYLYKCDWIILKMKQLLSLPEWKSPFA